MKTHKFDALSFLTGLAFTFIGLAFLVVPRLGDLIEVVTNAGAWFWPIVFMAVGIAILAPVLIGREPPGITRAEDVEDEDDREAEQSADL